MKHSESMPVDSEEDTLDIAHIAGNADEIKQTVGNPAYFFTNRRPM
jgi:hypothetical protein